MAQKIRKVTVELFCFARDAKDVQEMLADCIADCEAPVSRKAIVLSDPTPQEDAQVRPDLEG